MGYNTFGPLLVLHDPSLEPARGVAGTVVDAQTLSPVTVYEMGETPAAKTLVTNIRGYVGQFQAPDTSTRLRITFGTVTLEVVAQEVQAASVTSVNGENGVVVITAAGIGAQPAADLDADVAALVADPASDLTAGLTSTFEARVSGDDLDATLAALPAYSAGGPLRRVVVKPGTYSRATTLFVPSGVHLVAHGATFTCATPGSADELLGIVAVTDVLVEGGVWDGNRAAWAGAPTDYRHAVNIIGSSRVKLRDLTAKNAYGDGIYVGNDTTPCADIIIEACRSTGNRRNGMAISAVQALRATDSVFELTSGAHPMAGLDIEANLATTIIDDVTFTGCRFTGNAHYGAMVSQPTPATARQGGITFTSCSFDGNGTAGAGDAGYRQGLRLHGASDVRLVGGQIRGNAEEGVLVTAASTNIQIIGVEVAENGKAGFSDSLGVTRLSIIGSRFVSNSQASSGAYDGINLDAGTGVGITGTVSTGATQRYGLRTTANVSYLNLVGGSFTGNATGDVSLADDAVTRFRADRSGVTTAGAVESSRAAASDTGVSTKITGDAAPRVLVRADGDIRFGDGTTVGDTRLYRSAADTLRTTDTFVADVALQTAGAINLTSTGAGTGYIEFREQSSAPAGSTDKVRLYAIDNGSGKTQLAVIFGSGAPQVLATQS